MPSSDHLSTPQRILRTSQLNKIAVLPDGMAIPPPPSFLPPPPPPPSFGRKRQRSGNSNTAASPEQVIDDEDANYIVYPSDDEQDVPLRDDSQLSVGDQNEDYNDGAETPRNRTADSDGDFGMESDAEFSEDQEPQRKRAKAGGEGELDDDDEVDDPDANNSLVTGNNKGKRRVSQKWREDVYRPTPGADSDDSDLNLAEVTPEKKRGKRKSVSKTAGGSSRKPAAPANGLARNKSKSTPNLRTDDKPEPSNIRKSRFYEGSMNDRFTRKGGVPPFVNYEPTGEADSGALEYNSFGMLVSSASSSTMPPPPRPFPKSDLPQSTPPPPKSKFTFFAPISNWFSKRWQKATQEYEERERRKDQEVEVQRQVRILMDRKAKAEKLYAENKLKGINQPRMLDQRIEHEPLVTEEQVTQLLDTPSEIGIAYTTDDVYAAPKMNESAMSLATIRAVPTLQGPTPRASTESTGSGGFVGIPRSSHAALGGFHRYRDTDFRDGTPLTTDTTDRDIEGFRSRSRSPVPTPSKPLTKAEQKKKERLEKKMLDLKKKLAETELDLSQVLGNEPLATSTPAPKAATITKVLNADETIILIHENGENREGEDEADKIVESVMGVPEPTAALPARNRSMSPLKKLLNIGTKKSKDTGNSLHTVNESAKIKKSSPSNRGRGGGARGGGRGGNAVSKKRNESPDELTAV
ncbi:uncharacterized protein DFL_000189 [Arthrobotrys flagrans]|uniref:Uncharacterized protein n=1 Tax=Arthrobotrys flagrans TaxID=97331 RepID=A0A437AEM2_ARTFL|nr:hypothetical protein DFL_000189 [Arthrobotrys flagrans]